MWDDVTRREPQLGKDSYNDYNCREIDTKGLIVKMLDHELSVEQEDALLFHIRHCTDCMAIVADILFTRSQFEKRGKDYTFHVN
jgi:hypothetical protein